MTHSIQAIVLAAGKSSRFQTGNTKLIATICGQEMIVYITRLLASLSLDTTIVVGFQKEAVIARVKAHHDDTISFIEQTEQHGTGHALMCTQDRWHKEHLLILNGDIPLLQKSLLTELIETHTRTQSVISFVTAHNPDPALQGYGRLINDEDNAMRIVEAHEFTADANKHCCVNAGIYIVEQQFARAAIAQLQKNKKSNEFYITDLVDYASKNKLPISTVAAPFDTIRGINTLQELWVAEQIKRGEVIKYWMERGVHFPVAQTVHIDANVTIGAGSIIECGVHLLGNSSIGKNVSVGPFSVVDASSIGDNSIIHSHSIIKKSSIGKQNHIGPFAHIHTNSVIGDQNVIGNFMEVKQTTIADHTKAKHLAYLGDATIGSHVNIGAGTIVCNHNGVTKNKTTINDGAFIGSNNTLVAPLIVGSHAFTAAGSVITESVPADALAIGRARQINKEGYALLLKEKAAAHKKNPPSEQNTQP